MHEHDETIAMLRGIATDGREATGADVATAMHVGRKIRRRRRAAQAVGSGFVLSAALGVIVVANGMSGQGIEVVPASPAAPPVLGDAKPTPGTATAEAKRAVPHQEGNVALLAEALGPDFRPAAEQPGEGDLNLNPASPSAAGLGSGYAAGARIDVFDPAAGFSVQSACKPTAEKGVHGSECRAVKLDNGRVVQVQDNRTVPGEWKAARSSSAAGVWDSEMLYFARADGTFVRIEFFAHETTQRPAAAQQEVSDKWLTSYIPRLAKVAADPRVSPKAAAAADNRVQVTDHDRDQAILQRALGGSFSLLDGTVQLEPGSEKAAELPDGTYSATAELSSISSAAFHAACDAKAGLKACETKTLDDGTVVHLRSWADRDATDSEMRGESAVYLQLKDGSVLLANLKVNGRNVNATDADKHATIVRQWLDSLQDALTTAVTDPDVVGAPSSN